MKKEAIIPISVITLSIAFIFISLMVYFSRGKSKKWVARKMRIGGLLLTLTATASCNNGDGEVMCYSQVAPNSINLHAYTGDTIKLNPDTNNILTGSIYEVNSSAFSYAILDTNNIKIQKGNILAKDSVFNNSASEDFYFDIPKSIQPGLYFLEFFDVDTNEQDSAYYINRFQIKIEN